MSAVDGGAASTGMPPLPSNPAEDASSKILGATLSVTILAFVVWSMRMYVRLVMVRNVGMDVSRPLSRDTGGFGQLTLLVDRTTS